MVDIKQKLEFLDFDFWMKTGLANFDPGSLYLSMHGFTSGVHTKEDVEETVNAFRTIFELLMK